MIFTNKTSPPKPPAGGADQELDACCEWLQDPDLNVDTYKLRAVRRPKPPSLAEQGLAALGRLGSGSLCADPVTEKHTIRTALERLKELEKSIERRLEGLEGIPAWWDPQ
jgi:hypothetical protein